MRRALVAATFALLSSLPVSAFAARAYTVGGAQIFAGPGDDYPVVAQLGRGVAVNVNGCLSDYSWCDVNLGPNRGWVYAQDLAYPYRNRRVLIPDYGPQLGLPLITFSLNTYWDRYYRGRPFYDERGRWERHWRESDHARGDEHRYSRGRPQSDDFRAYHDGRDYRDQQDARNAQRVPDQQDRHRGGDPRSQARAAERGSLPDIPGGGQQGLPPGDHSRYQQ